MIERKSRFLGHALPVQEEQAALDFLRLQRERYRDASHNCYAYILGANEGIMRYSDDGEPGGTAGMPILSVLRARGVVDAVVVVTRYFGGVLLGAGGLVRAYTAAAALAVNGAGVVRMEPSLTLLVEVAYSQWDSVVHALKSAPVRLLDTDFLATVNATLQMRERDEAGVLALLTRVTDGRLETLELSRSFAQWQAAEPAP